MLISRTDQDCGVLHSDAGGRGSQGSAHSMVVLETNLGLGCRGSSKALWDEEWCNQYLPIFGHKTETVQETVENYSCF